VPTIRLGEGTQAGFRSFPGQVDAARTLEMFFPVPGSLSELPAAADLLVAQDELLAGLAPENFEARLASAEARLVKAREEFARRQQQRGRGVISDSELEGFRRNLEVAESTRGEAQQALAQTVMRAPFDGRVARTLAAIGENMDARQPVLLLQDLAQLEIGIEVPAEVMAGSWQGLTADMVAEQIEAVAEFPALSDQSFPLVLKSFGTAASATTDTFRVVFQLDPPLGAGVWPGMACRVLVRRVGQNALAEGIYAVPAAAVDRRPEGPVVWRVRPGSNMVEAVTVELETPAGDFYRIRSSELQPADEIVASGTRDLAEGLRVRPRETSIDVILGQGEGVAD